MSLSWIILMDILTYGAWIFIVSLGLTIIFGVLRILNLAHGSIYAVGAYIATTLGAIVVANDMYIGWVFPLMIAGTFVVAAVVGLLIERIFIARFYGRDEILLLLVTYAMFLAIEDVTKIIWGTSPKYLTGAYDLIGSFQIGGFTVSRYDLMLIFVALVCGAAAWLLFNRTNFGKVVAAVIENPEASRSFGVNTRRVYSAAFVIGLFFAALGGAFTAPMIAVQPGLAVSVIITSFAVVVIGGLGSIQGAAVGAIIVALAKVLSVHFAPSLELFSIYAAMLLTLLLKPEGLFSGAKVRKI
jgi:branched-chain amino acid transport system permease protein